MAKLISDEFNKSVGDWQKASEFINGFDVLNEPILVGTRGEVSLIHHKTGEWEWSDVLPLPVRKDDVEAFLPNDLAEEYDQPDFMTFQQYQDVAKVLDDNRQLLDEVTRSQMLYMFDRIKEIKSDMAEHNLETQNVFVPSTLR
ncbi:MAG: hypothetical protein CL570_04745 [Alphaproteobacteria bacterium]|nr:hypothetical protein [Alphaproteobacteria bacterium]HCQ71587.1 hypothetical protein [Rhodospirillaceae bacterium]